MSSQTGHTNEKRQKERSVIAAGVEGSTSRETGQKVRWKEGGKRKVQDHKEQTWEQSIVSHSLDQKRGDGH